MDRRAFILRSSSTLAAVSTTALTPLTASAVINTGSSSLQAKDGLEGFSDKDWSTIASVQNHLFPSEQEAPGAVEINALSYLHDFLSNPATDSSEVEFILSGVLLLQRHLSQTYSQQMNFADLSIEQREILLREFEKQADGRRWLVNILNYILEALLTDPVYGGNPDGIGWKWLEYRAGEPRPPADKRYWLL